MAEFIECFAQIIEFFMIITPLSGLLYLVSTGLARRFINQPKPLRLEPLLAEKKFDHKSAVKSNNIPLMCEYNVHGINPVNDIKHAFEIMRERLTKIIEKIDMASLKMPFDYQDRRDETNEYELIIRPEEKHSDRSL